MYGQGMMPRDQQFLALHRRPHRPSGERQPKEAEVEQDVRHIGGGGLPAEPVGIVDRPGNDEPPKRAGDGENEHQQTKLGMDAKRLELFARPRERGSYASPSQAETGISAP
jgi:hypothetical protein